MTKSLYKFILITIVVIPLSYTINIEDIWADSVIKDLETSLNPIGIEYNPDNHDMYISHFSSGDILVIDSNTNKIIDTIDSNKTTTRLDPMKYNPSNHYLYVLNYDYGDITVINTLNNEVVITINIGNGSLEGGITSDGPISIEYNPDNHNMYVTNDYSGKVYVIDSLSNMVSKTIEVGDGPDAIKYNPDNKHMYVINNEGTASVIDTVTDSVTTTIDFPESAGQFDIEYNPDNHDMYVSSTFDGKVFVIDGTVSELADTIDVGVGAYAIEYNPSNNNMYVANLDSSNPIVSIIATASNTVSETVSVGNFPIAIEYNPSNNNMYVVNTESDSVSIIDAVTNSIEAIYTGDGPTAIELNPSNNNMYVVNEVSNTVSVVDTSSITPPPPAENPRTIADILKSILENPLDIANSLDSANEIKEILTDDDRNNDQLVCDLMDGLSQGQIGSIRSILKCE